MWDSGGFLGWAIQAYLKYYVRNNDLCVMPLKENKQQRGGAIKQSYYCMTTLKLIILQKQSQSALFLLYHITLPMLTMFY